jgi:hypothetical protein
MLKDLFGKVREQPAHDGLEAFRASGFVQSLVLVLGIGPGLRFLGSWHLAGPVVVLGIERLLRSRLHSKPLRKWAS